MIEDLIETGQYKEALRYLNDLEDEKVRYQRLVCLYGMQELQQAKKEGLEAKALAEETYYDVVAIYVSILKDLEEFEEAINIIVEELSISFSVILVSERHSCRMSLTISTLFMISSL